ncbi:MORC family CW-type zinc finger protein 3 [Cyprinodon tularosa]|uniref:MORC family CW-type zinc finger protein 3 n=1 Tax=Cyprinodon tularosa TaxID=77115 RepID=UPI0018E275F7|nr:MORC family CW-type zinc finger protein 3 [Cyprinodon tularosa]
MARLSEHGIRLSSMSPSFLNSNSTSHTWPFSAVAELIDNASDPGVCAKQIWIDVVKISDELCLTFTDNGSGMTPNKLHKMLSFGFTEKGSGKASQNAIGLYGNGFKSGSMRLGRDALIFTKNGGCQTVGLLSQTYLQNIKAQAVIVPIVPFNQQTRSLVVTEDSEASLAAILEHSIIKSQEEILTHFDSIPSKKGTKILIWNIRRAKDGKTEIDFDSDSSDFRLPEIHLEELKQGLRNSGTLRPEQNIPDMYYSLRAYLSILYLKPRTQVILRGKKVLAKLVSKSLTHIEHDVYKPQFSKEKVKVTFGLNPKKKEHYGIMMYHKNRLIKAYEKVGCQLKASGQRVGIGVIGIIECNFLKPAHNKQDFEYTKEYRLTLGALGLKLNDFWKEVTEKRAREREFQALDKEDGEDQEDSEMGPLWLQCEECLKWRSVPPHYYKVTPENWTCSLNPNRRYRSCSSPEETEESEEQLTPSYQKNHKKIDQSRSRKREKSREVHHSEELAEKNETLSPISSKQPCSPSPNKPEDGTHEKRLDQDEACLQKDNHANDEIKTRLVIQYQGKVAGSKLVNEELKEAENVEYDQRLEEKEDEDKQMETVEKQMETVEKQMEAVEREEEHTEAFSRKRKSEPIFTYITKKRWRQQQLDSGNAAEHLPLEKQTNTFRKDSSSQVEKPNNLQQNPTNNTWTYSTQATQTVVVSPLRTERPQSRALPPELGEREVKVQKLAALEREAERLRSLLGLEVSKKTQGTMTTADSVAEKGGMGRSTASTTSKDVGCQTTMPECSTSAPGMESRSRKERSESQSRVRVSDGDGCDENRSAQQNLCDIRNNVVVLLTALLPQLDLAGISLESADVDNILQQIIEVNSLKL